MLGKLYKYDMKAQARIISFCFPLVLLMATFTKISSVFLNKGGENNFILALTIFLGITFFLSLMAMFMIITIISIQRFYSDLVSSSGYLMHTLPVSPANLIFSKLLSAFTWIGLSLVTTVLAIMIFFIDKLGKTWDSLVFGFKMMAEEMGTSPAMMIICYAVMFILGIASTFLIFYLCIAIGQIANKNKLLWAFVAYIVYYIAMQAISMISMFVMFGTQLFQDTLPVSYVKNFFTFEIIVLAVMAVGSFIATNIIFKKKLNLQ